ncbi:Gfo/Idh/MocA family oxidoreductase [Butyrivibrio sp. FCS014]|uniref:Gfo/Idh/MocA family oxidoreductase n=1 Tax=Butyrivibrio sp. FCS014 TaxID=1408304 RepID=UPI000467C394|nr:Gfo/Idh/MocA family oxidoreductase [Butyrivibrio sp. FCS014]
MSDLSSINYIMEIIKNDLCSGCGMCAAVCPKKVFSINNGKSVVEHVSQCINCDLCKQCCPAMGYSLEDSSKEYFINSTYFVAKSTDDKTKKDSSAGGFITSFTKFLLESKKVDYVCAVITGDSQDEPLSKYIITDDPKVIFECRKSKYTQASLTDVIEHILNHDATYAVVALPCQWYGLKQYSQRNKKIENSIKYKIGLVCGYTYENECLDALLKAVNLEKDFYQKIEGWRIDGLPGSFSVKDIKGNSKMVPFDVEHSIDVTFYAQNRCLLCEDCFCQNADFAASDFGAWKNVGTLLSIHNNHVISELDQAKVEGYIEYCDFCSSQIDSTVIPFMIREKRNKVEKRLKYYKKKGIIVPLWIGGTQEKLTLAHRFSDTFSVKLQRHLKQRRNAYLGKPNKMLKLGRLSYHGIDRWLPVRVMNKTENVCHKVWGASEKISNFYHYHVQPIMRGVIPKSSPLKVGVIGLGNWGVNYLRYLSSSSHYQIKEIFDVDEKRVKFYSKKYNVVAALSIEEIMNDNSLDAVFLLTPPFTHEEILNTCNIDQNIYIEKPLASTYKECSSIVYVSSRFSNVYVAHSMKFEPVIKKIKEMIMQDTIGIIKNVKVVRSVPMPSDSDWRRNIEHSALFNLGVHLVEILHFLFGNELEVQVSDHSYFSDSADSSEIILKYSNFDAELLCAFDKTYEFVVRIEGDKGHIVFDGKRIKLNLKNWKNKTKSIKFLGDRVIKLEIEDFYTFVKGGKETDNSLGNAVDIINTIENIINCRKESKYAQDII